MFQRFPIRRKLVTALAVPLVALLAVASFEALKALNEKSDIDEQVELATSTVGPAGLAGRLVEERNSSFQYLLGVDEDIPREATYAETDEALSALEDQVESKGGKVRRAYGGLIDDMAALQGLRDQVASYTGPRNITEPARAIEVFDGYTGLLNGLFNANRRVTLDIDEPDLRRGAQLIDLGARQTDLQYRLIKGELLAAFSSDGVNTPQEVTQIAADLAELQENTREIQTKGTGRYQSIVDTLLATEHVQSFPEIIQNSLDTSLANLQGAMAAAKGPSEDENGFNVFRQSLEEELTSEADGLRTAAELRYWLFVGLAAAVVATALVATWLVARSITRPLRSLTDQASDMANHRLPDAVLDILDTPLGDDVVVPDVDPVTVRTRDEVADVAEALNTVQDSALELAVEQAVLRRNIADSFVNLGRRNQNLLGRQLDFITELEHNETDPDTLSNLFRLDHLATRMRRNAESLLVLAGIDPPRKWAAPVKITDVIRAALGEVEDYQRVTVRAVEPATIMGSVAADLAHLMAELIENALIFSPPDQNVEIRGRIQPSGYTLAIIDSGLGMPPEELARANRRLAGAESFTIAPSKYLGHYVAGNLAARHNINVQLHNSPGHGITATINLPGSLLTADVPEGGVGAPVTADAAPGAPQLRAAQPPAPPPPAPSPPSPPPAAPTAPPPGPFAPPARPAPAAAPPPPPAAPVPPPPGPASPPPPRPAPEPAWPEPGQPPAAGEPEDAPLPAAATADMRSGSRAPTLPSRTGGGLAKRAPGSIPTRGTAAARPNQELLDTLATYTTHLHRQIDPNRPPTPPSGGPGVPPLPPFNPTPPPGTPSVRPGFPPPDSRSGDAHAHATPTTHSPAPEHTPSGLARRVRGAQMPQTQPVGLHRHSGEVPAVGRAPRRPQPAASGGRTSNNRDHRGPEQDARRANDVGSSDANAQARSAKDVYSFLSSFSAGVQRGLDEAHRSSTTSEEDQ